MLTDLLQSKLIMGAILALLVVSLAWSLRRKSASTASRFNVEDYLLGEDGKASRAAGVMIGSFILTSWIVAYLTFTGKLTEGYFGLYLTAWVIPAVTKLIKGPIAMTTETTMATTTTIAPPRDPPA